MKNQKVAYILNRIADYLEMGGVDFRTKAYRNAAHTVEILSKEIEDIRAEGRLEDLPGIGKSIAKKIDEILDTGSLRYYEELKENYPVDLESLLAVEGLGPKTIKLMYEELGITNLDDLEKNAKLHRIRRLKGMGEKTEKRILENIEFARKSTGRGLLGYVMPLAERLKVELGKLEFVDKVEIAGSLRRMKETVGDIDILVTTQRPDRIMDYFVDMEMVEEKIVKGPSKSTVRLKSGIETDLRVFKDESFGAAMVYFTGSKELNIVLRKMAIKKEVKLNEYGVFQGERRLAGKTEEEVFRTLGLNYIEPELRENRGEIEAAMVGMLPNLINYDELKGDLQMHSIWSDGSNSIEEMAMNAQEFGYEYIAITDHTGGLRIAGGMDSERIKKQMKEIDLINQKMDSIRILSGVEVNIKSDGKLDVEDEILKDLDLVIASIHSGFRQEKDKITNRIISAMLNENVDIIAHPTGRKIQERKAYDLDFRKIFKESINTNTLLEINSQPNRLDLNDINIKRAIDSRCKLVINTDSHNIAQLKNIKLGIATARRGWAEKKDIINSLPLKKLEKYFS
jgi:DNA polymerase (family X)